MLPLWASAFRCISRECTATIVNWSSQSGKAPLVVAFSHILGNHVSRNLWYQCLVPDLMFTWWYSGYWNENGWDSSPGLYFETPNHSLTAPVIMILVKHDSASRIVCGPMRTCLRVEASQSARQEFQLGASAGWCHVACIIIDTESSNYLYHWDNNTNISPSGKINYSRLMITQRDSILTRLFCLNLAIH